MVYLKEVGLWNCMASVTQEVRLKYHSDLMWPFRGKAAWKFQKNSG